VIAGPDNLFALPEVDVLLREELARLPAFAARRPTGRALLLQPCASSRDIAVDTRHLAALRVHAERAQLRGDVVCSADALPWEDDAFQLVFAQHVGDVLPDAAALIDELVRVLAPGGVLLYFGFNPWSPWLAWIHWQARHGLPVPRMTPADIARARLSKRGLRPARIEHLGSCWPQRDARDATARSSLLDPLRGAWLIAAEKRRAILTPLRPRNARARMPARPQLATPNRRASA
jgi:SAM-dependent methyltransferase